MIVGECFLFFFKYPKYIHKEVLVKYFTLFKTVTYLLTLLPRMPFRIYSLLENIIQTKMAAFRTGNPKKNVVCSGGVVSTSPLA